MWVKVKALRLSDSSVEHVLWTSTVTRSLARWFSINDGTHLAGTGSEYGNIVNLLREVHALVLDQVHVVPVVHNLDGNDIDCLLY